MVGQQCGSSCLDWVTKNLYLFPLYAANILICRKHESFLPPKSKFAFVSSHLGSAARCDFEQDAIFSVLVSYVLLLHAVIMYFPTYVQYLVLSPPDIHFLSPIEEIIDPFLTFSQCVTRNFPIEFTKFEFLTLLFRRRGCVIRHFKRMI